MAHALFVIFDMGAPIAFLLLDVFRNGQAFHDFPSEARRGSVLFASDELLARRNFIRAPDVSGWNVVQGADHSFHSGLKHVLNPNSILRTEPPPRLTHLPSPVCCSWRPTVQARADKGA